MTTIARKLATWMKLTSSPENPQSHIIYDTPLGIQVGSQKLNRNHGAFADTTALDAFLLSKGLTAGDGDEALIGEPGSYALYRYLNGSWSASAGGGGGGSVTVNNTLTSTSTTSALSAAQGKVLQDTKQANLVSGTNIKTVNGTSILGPGDIVISGGGGASIPALRAIDTAGRTLVAADLSNLVRYNSASNANFTIPTDATLGITDANANVSIELYQMGTGRLDIVADTANGVTLNKWVGYPPSVQYVTQTIHRVAPNTWAVK